MTRLVRLLLLLALSTLPARAQGLVEDLKQLTALPGVTGYERELGDLIRQRLSAFHPQTDNLGNIYVTLGTGGPRKLIVTPLDEPGYVVSRITAEGYLRLQRLPQQAPPALFDQLHFAQPVVISTRSGKRVPGVIAGLSVHLQPGRRDAPHMNHPDEMYVDIGATNAAEVRQAGVDLLDPVTLERTVYQLGGGQLTAPAIGDRFGAAVLLELLTHCKDQKFSGTVTIAFVTRQWAGSRGIERLLEEVPADEMIYVGRLIPPRAGLKPALAPKERPAPGNGVLLATANSEQPVEGLAADLAKLAEANHITLTLAGSGPLPHSAIATWRGLPARFAHLAVPISWPVTPAEIVGRGDLSNLATLLRIYLLGPPPPGVGAGWGGGIGDGAYTRPQTAPAMTELLSLLVETYGASGHESAVREKISALLPPWAKPETDPAGNLVLKLGVKAPDVHPAKLLFVAHMDEIGYEVKSIAPDGRLEVEALGGGVQHYFAGHPVLLHTAKSILPGVLELPAGWDAPGFEWPRDRAAQDKGRIDVGARSAEEAEKIGIRVGDWATIPKKYRPLLGTRANGRSFDDRVGCAALIAATWALGPSLAGREVTLIWSTQEEVGLLGAARAAQRLAAAGASPDYVFAIDTFVSSDSPLELDRFGYAPIGQGFVVRAVDNSNIAPRELVERVMAMARANGIPAQYGVTGGGNDGSVFTRFGTVDVPLAWPLRYSHSPAEVIDVRDAEALGRIIAVLAQGW
jgi:putative aminopeptidase FrvX